MKQVEADKYNVAWFKLADCIARGEKERAIGVYRLLSHSLDDKALACQLFADILLSFQDEQAHTKYKEAATLYQDTHRILEAAAVYEHLCTIQPDNIDYKRMRLELYQQMAIGYKVEEYTWALLNDLIKAEQWNEAIELVRAIESYPDESFIASINAQLVMGLLPTDQVLFDTKVVHAQKAVELWKSQSNEKEIKKFIGQLKKESADIVEKITCD